MVTLADIHGTATGTRTLQPQACWGIVVDHNTDLKNLISKQFEKFYYKAAKIAAGKMSPDLSKPMQTLTALMDADNTVESPDASQWTTGGVVDTHPQTRNDKSNVLQLLTHLKDICYSDCEASISPTFDVLLKTKKFIDTTYQDNTKDATSYVKEAQMRFKAMKAAGISIESKAITKYCLKTSFPDITYEDYSGMNEEARKPVKTAVEELLVSVQIIERSNQKSHRNIQGKLRDQYCLKKDAYLTKPADTLGLLVHFRPSKTPEKPGTNSSSGSPSNKGKCDSKGTSKKATEGSAFVTIGEVQEAHQLLINGIADGETFGSELCFVQISNMEYINGKKEGSDCTYSDEDSASTTQTASGVENSGVDRRRVTKSRSEETQVSHSTEYLLAQHNGHLDPHLLLLDSQATCNVISNKALLSNIREHPKERKALPGFGTAWYLKGGIANILSLGLVSDQYQVTLDTSVSQLFYAHKADGTTHQFTRAGNNLYISCDICESIEAVFTITTEDGTKDCYSNVDIKRVEKAKRLHEIMGFPSTKELLHMVDNNLIQKCTVTRRDISMAYDIYGVNTNIVKGKTVRHQPQHVHEDITPVFPSILMHYKNVSLVIDVYLINGIKFFCMISWHIRYQQTSQHAINNVRKSTLTMRYLTSMFGLYTKQNFVVTQVFGDNKFAWLENNLLWLQPPVALDYDAARNEHEPHIERDNQTSKDRCQRTFAAAPYIKMPHCMIMKMFLTLILAETFHPDQRHLDEHEDHDNSMNPRAVNAIYLWPSNNKQGDFFVFDLKTARHMHRCSATLARITNTIIQRVRNIADKQSAPDGLTFGDRHGNTAILDLDTESVGTDDGATDASFHPIMAADDTDDTVLTGVSLKSYSNGIIADISDPPHLDMAPNEAIEHPDITGNNNNAYTPVDVEQPPTVVAIPHELLAPPNDITHDGDIVPTNAGVVAPGDLTSKDMDTTSTTTADDDVHAMHMVHSTANPHEAGDPLSDTTHHYLVQELFGQQEQSEGHVCEGKESHLWNPLRAILFWKKLITIVWYVDDLKISYKNKEAVDGILARLNEEVGKLNPISVTRGKVKFSMFDYIAEVLDSLPDSLKDNSTAPTPAAAHLFDVSDDTITLGIQKQDQFHSCVAKLLFIASKTCSPKHINANCVTMYQAYLHKTIALQLVLGWDGNGVGMVPENLTGMWTHPLWWYTLICKATPELCRLWGKERCCLCQQNNRSIQRVQQKPKWWGWLAISRLTCGVDTIYIGKGITPKNPVLGEKSILYQDNTSSIKLETNGRSSSTKQTCHINIRYFMVTDRVKSGEIAIEYCPIGHMLADKFRNNILGINEEDVIAYKTAYEKF
eukprot:jgi/Psemu1/5275/gm1.5275_g